MSKNSNKQSKSPLGTELSESERHRLLVADRRRWTLNIITRRETPVELTELAAKIGTIENKGHWIDEGTIESVAITLHHQHLPMLADAGVLEYDPETQMVYPEVGSHNSTGSGSITS